MNRKQRRAALKQALARPSRRVRPTQLFARAVSRSAQNKLATPRAPTSACCCSNPITPRPCNNLGCVLLAQGKRNEASACFAQALTLMPQLFSTSSALSNAHRGIAADRRSFAAGGAALARRADRGTTARRAGLAAIAETRRLAALMLESMRGLRLSRSSAFSRRCAPLPAAPSPVEAGGTHQRLDILLRSREAVLHQRIRVRDHAGRRCRVERLEGALADARRSRCGRGSRHGCCDRDVSAAASLPGAAGCSTAAGRPGSLDGCVTPAVARAAAGIAASRLDSAADSRSRMRPRNAFRASTKRTPTRAG